MLYGKYCGRRRKICIFNKKLILHYIAICRTKQLKLFETGRFYRALAYVNGFVKISLIEKGFG